MEVEPLYLVMMKYTLLILSMVSLFGFVAIIGVSTDNVLAQKNGWGKATSEEAKEDGSSFGGHASDPDGDGTKGNDNQANDGDNQHRSGIGNVAEQFTGSKNPNELGGLLDNLDCDDSDDTC